MSQIVPQSPAYISYTFDSITISQVGGDAFTFSVYTIDAVGGITFVPLTFQDRPDDIQARTIEIYRLLVTSIFKGCCECGNTEPECSIQYTAGNGSDAGTFLYDSGGSVIRVNNFTANNQDFSGFWPIIQDGSWIFVFSKTDPTVYGVYQLSNYSDGGPGVFAQFDAALLNGPGEFPEGTSLCVDVTSVGGSLVQDWQDTLNISSVLTQNNTIDGGGFNFDWGNVNRYTIDSEGYQLYNSEDGAGNFGRIQLDTGAVTITGTSYIDIITPNYGAASAGWVLAYDGSGHVEYTPAGTGTVVSVGLVMPSAFTVSNSPITISGDIDVVGAGDATQYINGLGELATLPVYTVENGLHTKEDPASDFVFHLGGQLIEDTLIETTEGASPGAVNEWQLSVRGSVDQNTRFPLGVANLGNGGVATFQDYGSGNRPNPSVEVVGDVDLFQPLLELRMEGNLPAGGVLADRTALLRLKYDGDPSLARMSIDYQFKNDDIPANNVYFIGGRLTTEVTNFTANAEESNFELQLFSTGSRGVRMVMEGKGQLELTNYATSLFWNGDTNINNDLEYVLAVDNTGKVWKKVSEGGGTVLEVDTEGLITGGPITTTGTITTSVQQNRLVGRWDTGGAGIMQEITIGDGLTLSATGELTAEGGGGTYDGDQGIYKDTTLTNDTFQLGAPSGSQGTIPFAINRYIDVADKFLQMEGTSSILNLIENSAAPLTSSAALVVATDLLGYSASFTALQNSAVLANTQGTDLYALEVTNQGTGNDSYAAYFECSHAHGVQVSQGTYSSFLLSGSVPSSSAIDPILLFNKNSSGTPSVGQGISILFEPGKTSDGATITPGTTLNSFVTDITPGAGAVDFRIDTYSAGASLNHATFIADGQLKLHEYGQTPANFPDAAPVWALGVDASGNVVEFDPGGGGGTYDSDQGIYKDTSLTNDTFQLGAPSGSQGGIAFSIDRFIDTTDNSLQMEGSATILKTIQNSAAPITTNGTFLSTASAGGSSYAGVFTGYEFAALLAYSVGEDTYALEVTNAGTGADGLAAVFQCDAGAGIQVSSSKGSLFSVNGGTITDIYPVLYLQNGGGPISNGVGASIEISPGAGAFGTIPVGVSLNTVISDIGTIVGDDQVVDFRVDTLYLGAVQQHTSFIGSGQLQLHEYTTSTSFAAGLTSIGVLNVDNTGKVFVGDGGGGPSPLTTKGDLYTYDTADTRLPVGLNTQVLLADSSTPTGLRWGTNTTPPASGYYGAFQDDTTQTAVSANTAYPVKFNTTDLSNGVTVVNDGSGNPTRVTLANTGIYNVQFSLQLEKTGGSGNFVVDIWLRKNGVDIPDTTGKVVLTGSASASPIVAAWNYLLDLAGGDYVQLMWSTTNNNAVILAAVATPPHPGVPSSILTVTQQAGILAGTGITAINSLTGAVQTMGVGTGGTDFAIDSTGAAHTFNLPTANATNRGALSNTDWTRFDSFKTQTIGVTVDGSGGTITVGQKGYVQIPYACTITGWRIITNATGTLVFDVDKAAAGTIPTVSITGSAPPTLGAGQQTTFSSTLTGWTTTINANDMLGFTVDSATTVSWAILQLFVTRT
jgi:hypothetical protein